MASAKPFAEPESPTFREKVRTAFAIMLESEEGAAPSARDVAKDRLRCTLTFDRAGIEDGEATRDIDGQTLGELSSRVQSVMREFVELPDDGEDALVDVKQKVEGTRAVYSLSFRVSRVKPHVDAGLRELGEEDIWREALPGLAEGVAAAEPRARFRGAEVAWDDAPAPPRSARSPAPAPPRRIGASRDALEQELWGDYARGGRGGGFLGAVGGVPGALAALAAGIAAYAAVTAGAAGGLRMPWASRGGGPATVPLPVSTTSERVVPQPVGKAATDEDAEAGLSRRERRLRRAAARRAARLAEEN